MSQSLKLTLQADMKTALKAKDAVRLGVIRFLLADIRNWEIDNGEADDAAVQALVKKQVKQIRDALVDFEKAGRDEIVASESSKIQVLEEYLPQQMSDDELRVIVEEAVQKISDANMGTAMKAAMAAVAGRADGRRVSALVAQLLQS